MKYGLLTYRPANRDVNMGDFIQSLAARQFLPEVDVLIDKENLAAYSGPQVSMIMNGWFMRNPETWPPSDKITPLLISLHLQKSKYHILSDKKIINFLKSNGPVGCRDYETLDILQKHKIDSYLSSCLTLTLDEKYKYNGIRHGIYLVDSFFNYPNFSDIVQHPKHTFKNMLLGNLSPKDFLLRGKYLKNIFDKEFLSSTFKLTHTYKYSRYSEYQLFEEAEALLHIYARAELVITSRIHCALSCLALGTPVIFIEAGFENGSEKSNLLGVKELFNVIKIENDGSILSEVEGKIK